MAKQSTPIPAGKKKQRDAMAGRAAWALAAGLLLRVTAPAGETSFYDSRRFLDEIKTSQERYYEKTVRFYDSLLARRGGAGVLLEKCRFLETALYDPEREENPKYEEWRACSEQLAGDYPGDVEAGLYRLDHAYGDSAILLARALLRQLSRDVSPGRGSAGRARHLAQIQKSLAYAYSNLDSADQALAAGRAALLHDDSLPIHLLLARQYVSLGLREKARESLLQGETLLEPWERAQAGKLMLQLRYPLDAIRLYKASFADSSEYPDYSDLAVAYEQTEALDSARKYHRQALLSQYDAKEAGRKLFEFDLRHSPGDTALASYRALRDNGFKADPFSFYRIRLLLKHPGQPFMGRELLGLLAALLAVLAACAAPYLWLLPLHHAGSWLARHRQPAATLFTLRHLWMASTGILLAWFFAAGFFQYAELTYYWDGASAVEASDRDNALFLAAFSLLTTGAALFIMARARSWSLLVPKESIPRMAASLAVCFVILTLVRKANLAWFPELLNEETRDLGMGSVLTLIKSSLLAMGLAPTLLVTAVLVPIHEEFVFRGIGSEALGRYFPFWAANALQASAFALMHDALKLFPFYFTMGILLGWLYRRSGSLFTPILAHACNNLFAVWALSGLLQIQGFR